MNNKSDCECNLEDFIQKNVEFLKNPLIIGFLSNKENYEKFITAICMSTIQSNEELDIAFKEFYFNIRFTSYISTTIHFHGVNLDRKIREIAYRFPLQLDQPVKENPDLMLKNLLEYNEDYTINSNDILEYISDPILYKIIKSLTFKQREVLYLAYVKGLKDSEISIIQKKSQQAVFKSRKNALEKIKKTN